MGPTARTEKDTDVPVLGSTSATTMPGRVVATRVVATRVPTSPAVSQLAATPRANASSDAAACGWLEALAVSLLCTGGRVSCCRAMCLM